MPDYDSDCEWDCGRKATTVSTSCYDKTPILQCDDCLRQVLIMFRSYVHQWERENKRIFICECWRPVVVFDLHIDVERIVR